MSFELVCGWSCSCLLVIFGRNRNWSGFWMMLLICNGLLLFGPAIFHDSDFEFLCLQMKPRELHAKLEEF